MSDAGRVVYVIDDDSSVRVAIKQLLTLAGLHTEVFASVEEFLKTKRPETNSCLVLDVRLPGMSGLEFQDELAKDGIELPIIFITAQGDSAMTRRAMKAGAVDFLTKPFGKEELLEAIHQALERDHVRREAQAGALTLRGLFERLTPRERDVLDLVVAGMPNKQTAEKLGVSEATVKIHRRNIMEKTEAASLADLVKMAEKIKTTPQK